MLSAKDDRPQARSVEHQAGGRLKISRASRLIIWPRPGVPSADLAIMRHLDRLHLESLRRSRMFARLLASQGCKSAAGM